MGNDAREVKKIKILIYTTIFSVGGAERFVLDLVNNINLKLFEVILVIGRKNGTSYYKSLKKDRNIKYINLGSPDNQDDKIYMLLGDTLKKEKPDICFAPGIFTNFILLDALAYANYKGKCVIRESNYITSRNLNQESSNKILEYNQCDRIVVLTKGMKKDLVKHQVKSSKITLINNTVEIKEVQEKADIFIDNEEFNSIKGKKIIHVGRLEEQKNQKLLLRSFKMVIEKIKDVDLVIIGKGSKENELKKLSEELGISKKVHFIGFQENPYYFIKRGDLLVLSSLYEGMPHILLETMALKVPVLSTDCKTGPRDILKNGRYGYLVKNRDDRSMAKKIIDLLSNDKRRRKKLEKAYERACQYNAPLIIGEYEKVFIDVLKEERLK